MAKNERSAGFVVFRTIGGSREFLLLDYGRHWDLPKGHVEKGEKELDTALRELREETGIVEPQVIPDFRQEINYYFRDKKKGLVHKTVAFFLARTHFSSDEIILSREHEGFEFLPYDTAMKRITFPTARKILQGAEERLRSMGDNLSASASQK